MTVHETIYDQLKDAYTHVPPPKPGTQWRRMSSAQKRAAVQSALDLGRSPGSLATDHAAPVGAVRFLMNEERARRRYDVSLRPDAPAPHAPPPGPGVGIMALHSGVCHWPLWGNEERPGPAGLYCGAPVAASGPYCPTCAARNRSARQPAPGRLFTSGAAAARVQGVGVKAGARVLDPEMDS